MNCNKKWPIVANLLLFHCSIIYVVVLHLLVLHRGTEALQDWPVPVLGSGCGTGSTRWDQASGADASLQKRTSCSNLFCTKQPKHMCLQFLLLQQQLQRLGLWQAAQLSCSQPRHQLLLDVLRTPFVSSLAAVLGVWGSGVAGQAVSTVTQVAFAVTRPAHSAPIATQPSSLNGCFYSSSSKA